MLDRDTGKRKVLASSQFAIDSTDISGDGTQVVFVNYVDEEDSGGSVIRIVDVATGETETLVRAGFASPR